MAVAAVSTRGRGAKNSGCAETSVQFLLALLSKMRRAGPTGGARRALTVFR